MLCSACQLKHNPGPVLGYGGLDAGIMFISDVPKEKDVATGIPFTGIAKQRMVQAISDLGLNKGEYYFTYLIKHQLSGTDIPDFNLHRPCLTHLLEEIELINPKILCTMGWYTTHWLMSEYNMEEANKPLKELHGNGYVIPARKYYHAKYKKRQADRPKRYMVPTWSPAVDNPVMNHEFASDIMTLKTVNSMGILLYS